MQSIFNAISSLNYQAIRRKETLTFDNWLPSAALTPISALPTAPTSRSNWLIPSKLLIGTMPIHDDFHMIHQAGITTFVSLIGEYSFEQYKNKEYPRLSDELEFLHYPITDLQPTEVLPLCQLVDELKRRLYHGEILYIHCRGGHGRTGMVVIPLLCSLYQIPIELSSKYVENSTNSCRVSDSKSCYHFDMPETEEQYRVVEQAVEYIRKQDRHLK